MRLKQEYYRGKATELAPDLIGKLLCRNIDGKVIKLRITETECYFGEQDTACHAHKGKTARTQILYGEGGVAYVYLCYGIHCLLNVVTGSVEFPEAVLIRGVEGFNGPGKLTKALKIDRNYNGENLVESEWMWIEDDGYRPAFKAAKRVGIDYACDYYRNIKWRFILKGSE